jgi:hypothetical protein
MLETSIHYFPQQRKGRGEQPWRKCVLASDVGIWLVGAARAKAVVLQSDLPYGHRRVADPNRDGVVSAGPRPNEHSVVSAVRGRGSAGLLRKDGSGYAAKARWRSARRGSSR